MTPFDLPFTPRAIAAGLGGVWVVDRKGGAVVRLDPATGRITKRVPVGLGPVAVSLGADSVWVANQLSGTVSRIDPKLFTVHDTSVGTDPVDLAVGLGAVWVVRRTT